MKTLTLLVIVGAIAVLIVSGAISLQFHSDKLAGIGVWATDQASNFSVGEQIRDQVIALQRQGEDTFIGKDQTKLADADLERSKSDVNHLANLTDKTTNLAIITPAANLLLSTLDKLTADTKGVTVDHINQMKNGISNVFSQANVIFALLQSEKVDVSSLTAHLTTTSQTIQSYIGPLATPAPLEPPPP